VHATSGLQAADSNIIKLIITMSIWTISEFVSFADLLVVLDSAKRIASFD